MTGTRADYGLMQRVLKRLDVSEEFDLSLCVTGMHLSELYGFTVKEIEEDGFKICGSIPVAIDESTEESMALSIGYEIIGMTEVFQREKPDFILLLGDRGEMLAAAIVAVNLNIPVVHLHGGERSGTVDEMVRHAISKLSHYHFVATQESRTRLIKMGENEKNVFVVGAPGLEEFKVHNRIDKNIFNQRYGFDNSKKIALLLFHPVVQEIQDIQHQMTQVLEAGLACGLQMICLTPNSDAGGHLIREVLERYQHHPELYICTHLPRKEFVDCLAQVDMMMGNSSSGIIEAASFNLPVVNIGSRQNFRERSDNVIDVSSEYEAIVTGLKEALQRGKKNYINCYGDGNSSEICYELLKTIKFDDEILNKCNAY